MQYMLYPNIRSHKLQYISENLAPTQPLGKHNDTTSRDNCDRNYDNDWEESFFSLHDGSNM